jgi:diguanylate cyclase (GGDEF)-like protein
MTRRAWAYIGGVFLIAGALVVQSLFPQHPLHPNWLAVEILFGLAIGAQLFKVEAPNHVLFYATPIFFFAGVTLLDPFLLFLLIAVSHAAEWVRERWTGSEYLAAWYLQPFNVAMFWIAGRSAQGLLLLLHDRAATGTGWELAAIMMAAVVFVMLNHTILGVALVLARGISWVESGILDGSTFINDFVLLCVGSIVPVLWLYKPWFILPALAPIAFMYRALMIPQLKREAEMDPKTGLCNARHFNGLFAQELDRAQRFDRPLSVIMADLDHLRDINNVHGHLAGDAVLIGVAKVIHSTVRDYDIAARFGGEEFALLLPEVDEEQARVLAERLRRAIETATFTVPTSSAPLRASMSLGIACYPHDGRTTTELLHSADTAVYAAKTAGRNCTICASELPPMSASPEPAPLPTVTMGTVSLEPVPRGEPHVPGGSRSPNGQAYPVSSAGPVNESSSAERRMRSWVQAGFVSAVSLAGITALLIGVLFTGGASPTAVGLLTLLGALAELLEVDLFGQGTVSISVGIAFTAALLTGVEGLACVSGVIALVHHLRQRRGLNQLHRAVFNWAVHILAGLVVVGALAIHPDKLSVANLTLLAPIALAAAVGYFLLETGLIATAVALARGDRVLSIWRTHYRWLLPHYVVLCLTGLALSVSYTELSTTGVLIFAFPLLMMHYVQRQYVVQSRESLQTLQKLNRDLVRAALHDHLTGLGNERGFQEALRKDVLGAAERGTPLVLARVNVDEFRAINEESGRRHGDGLLVEVAARLHAAPALHHAYRLVADDFAVILPNTRLEEAAIVLNRFRQETPASLAGTTISIGLAALDGQEADSDLLNEQAFQALSEAKRRGRDAVVSFEEIRHSTPVASWAQAQGVRRLLTEKDMTVVFQPIWDIDAGSILGYEALVRPDMACGLVGPQEAFDVATRMGRARELDAVCRQAILARARELPPSARLFMNLAPESLEHGGLSGPELVAMVAQAGLRPDQVVLELTERSIIRPDTVVQEAQLLREYGFALALDDTGAGNAGLNVLSHLKVDFVKIDRSVVNHACSDQAARAVLAGIFALAHEMGAYVISEGIETVESLELVREMSLALAAGEAGAGRGVQGYLMGKPDAAVATEDEALQYLPPILATRVARATQTRAGLRLVVGGSESAALGW